MCSGCGSSRGHICCAAFEHNVVEAAVSAAHVPPSMIKDRPPRLDEIFQAYDAPLFFVTICTIHRQKIADLETVHRAFQGYFTRAFNDFGVVVGRYVIMPDHMHFLVRGSEDFELARWVNGLKRAMSVAMGATKKRPCGNPDFSITFCAMTRVTAKNGNTCRKILSEQNWFSSPINGRSKGNLS